MLHTKFQGHRPFGSREKDFLRFLPYMGMAAILVMWPGPFEQLSFSHLMEAPYEIWLQLAQWLQRRRCFKMLAYDGRRTTDGGACLYYKLTNEPKGSGELKMVDDDGRTMDHGYTISSPIRLKAQVS